MRTMFLLLAICAVAAGGDDPGLRLGSPFGDGMVLQRGKPVPVWGRTARGERLTVSIAGQSVATRANSKGRFRVDLKPLGAGGPHTLVVDRVKGGEVTLENVLVGDVWICSGQSNMQWPVSRSRDAAEETAAATWPRIRLMTVPNKTGPQAAGFRAKWVECSPGTVGGFSAVGYYFGRELHREIDVPIGLVNSSWGGTPAEAWTRRRALEAEPSLRGLLKDWDGRVKRHDPKKSKQDPAKSPHRPANLWEGKVAPLLPMAMRGAIWYQGESNAGRALQYRTLFPVMIRDWRAQFDQGDFPFLLVQLANFGKRLPGPAESAWAELEKAQLLTHDALPNTGIAVAIDIGEANDIHPKNKQEVGRRLALWALKVEYGRDIVCSGPVLERVRKKGGALVLSFKETGGGLELRGDGGFALAGQDMKWHPATARLDDDRVIISSPKVPNPVAARYAWADNPLATLYGGTGLPATPFRTDK